MTNSTFERLKKKFPLYVDRYLFKSNQEQQFLENLISMGEACIFGGVIRDYFLLPKKTLKHRDIDIVAERITYFLYKTIQEHMTRKTRYGGFSLTLDRNRYDIWELGNTWGLLKMNILNPSFSDLPKSSFFNINAVVFTLKGREVIADRSFQHAVTSRTLDILFEPNPYPELCIVKAYEYKSNFSLNISHRLMCYINRHFNSSLHSLVQIQLQHYGELKYSVGELVEFHDSLVTHLC